MSVYSVSGMSIASCMTLSLKRNFESRTLAERWYVTRSVVAANISTFGHIIIMAALRSRCGHYISVLRFLMVALWNRADHYIFVLFLLSFFYSPNLSRRRLDVYHTSTHGVALV